MHFDIQTGPPGSNGQSAVGADGQTWNGASILLMLVMVGTVLIDRRWGTDCLLQADGVSADVDVGIPVDLYMRMIFELLRLARYRRAIFLYST